jgi:signal transduction histidine kinase
VALRQKYGKTWRSPDPGGRGTDRMFRDFFKLWLRITFGPLFWIVAVQMAWAMVLLFWIHAYVSPSPGRAGPSAGIFGWGLVFLGLMLLGVNVVVIHFARQATHSRAVKDFISRVSHDLRSPLASVKLHLETLLTRETTPEQSRECLDAAWQDLGRLEAGIEGVLMASRLERQKLAIDAHTLGFRDFLQRYFARKCPAVILGGGHLESGRLEDLWVRADPPLLEKILDNLVDNALYHCPPGVNIRISLAKKNHFAVLTVGDDGPGIARKERRKIFRMFYRTPQNRGRGTGLGLFIVAGLVKAHGGQVWVDNPGLGSAFHVALPLVEEGERRS